MSLFGGPDSAPPSAPPSLPSSPGFPTSDAFSDFSIVEINRPDQQDTRRVSFSTFPPPSSDAAEGQSTDQDNETIALPPRGEDADEDQHSDYEDVGELDEAAVLKEKSWPRAWRHYTAQERQIFSSLVALRASDLSAHLYNTHHLKVRNRTLEAVAEARSSARKEKWVFKDEATGERAWMPETEWSAWPLEVDQVPAAEEGSRVGNYREKPSRGLEEELNAVFLRQAKNMWTRRNEHRRGVATYASAKPKEVVRRSGRRSVSRGPSTDRDEQYGASDEDYRSRSRRSSVSYRESELDTSVAESGAPIAGQASSTHQHSSPPSNSAKMVASVKDEDMISNDQSDTDTARPVFSADDERSSKLLAPTLRHVMADFDSLLLALHQHREGQYIRDREAGDTSEDSVRSGSARSRSSRSRSKSGKAQKQRASTPTATTSTTRRKRTAVSASQGKHVAPDTEMLDIFEDGEEDAYRNISSSESDFEESAPKTSITPKKKSTPSAGTSPAPSFPSSPSSVSSHKSRRQNTHKLLPRDWSEVLGTAALSGWNSAVIARATKRCESLFAEKMLFRTFPEIGPVIPGIAHAHTASADGDDEAGGGTGDRGIVRGGAGLFYCPFPLCKWHDVPFTRGYRWRDHLGRKHGQTKAQIAVYEKEAEMMMLVHTPRDTSASATPRVAAGGRFRQQVLDYNPMNWVPPDPLTCVHCREGSPIYSRISRLLDHLKRTHKYDPRMQSLPSTMGSAKEQEQRRSRSGTHASNDTFGSESGDDADEEEIAESEEDKDDDDEEQQEMLGGVHLDGFLQPVMITYGRGRDAEPRLGKGETKRNKNERKAAKRKRELLTEEEEREIRQKARPDTDGARR